MINWVVIVRYDVVIVRWLGLVVYMEIVRKKNIFFVLYDNYEFLYYVEIEI